MVCPSQLHSFTKFFSAVSEELGWQTVSVVSFILVKFLSSIRCNSEKKNWIKISCGYAHLHIMSFITTKFQKILLSSFRGVALTRKTGLTDGPKTSYPPQLIAWGIIIIDFNVLLFIFFLWAEYVGGGWMGVSNCIPWPSIS